MNQKQSQFLKQVIQQDNVNDSLLKLRVQIEENLFLEHTLSCLSMVEEFNPLLEAISQKYPTFYFSISQSYEQEYINLSSSVEIIDEDEISEFIEEINEKLNTFVFEQFSDSQIRKFFPNEDIIIKFNDNYSQQNFTNLIIEKLVNKEVMTFLHFEKLEQEMTNKANFFTKKSKI